MTIVLSFPRIVQQRHLWTRAVGDPDLFVILEEFNRGSSLIVMPEECSRASTDKEYGFPTKALGNDWMGGFPMTKFWNDIKVYNTTMG